MLGHEDLHGVGVLADSRRAGVHGDDASDGIRFEHGCGASLRWVTLLDTCASRVAPVAQSDEGRCMRTAVLLALVGARSSPTTASAITTNGFPDEGRHPAVGAILVPTRDGTGYAARVLRARSSRRATSSTASHCTSFLAGRPATRVRDVRRDGRAGRADRADRRDADHEHRLQGQGVPGRRVAPAAREPGDGDRAGGAASARLPRHARADAADAAHDGRLRHEREGGREGRGADVPVRGRPLVRGSARSTRSRRSSSR